MAFSVCSFCRIPLAYAKGTQLFLRPQPGPPPAALLRGALWVWAAWRALGTGARAQEANWKCAFLLREVISQSLGSTSAILFARAQPAQLLPPQRVLRSKLCVALYSPLSLGCLTPPSFYPTLPPLTLAASLPGQLNSSLFFFSFNFTISPEFNLAEVSTALSCLGGASSWWTASCSSIMISTCFRLKSSL